MSRVSCTSFSIQSWHQHGWAAAVLLISLALVLALTGQAADASSVASTGDSAAPVLNQAKSHVYLDSICQPAAEQWDAWRVVYQQVFQAGAERYGLLVSKYQDGSSQLCLTAADGSQGRRLATPTLQNQFIGDMRHEGGASFVLVVNGGNGPRVTLTRYRLNLNDPSRPALQMLEQWSGPPMMTDRVR